jgi:hypothetical protein
MILTKLFPSFLWQSRTAVLILSIPMIDAVYTMIRRLKKHRLFGPTGAFSPPALEIGWGKTDRLVLLADLFNFGITVCFYRNEKLDLLPLPYCF